MNIHPLWYLCITVRLSIVFIIRYFKKNNLIKKILQLFLLSISIGFFYKSITGSNNEKQISKVFWHEARLIHGILYLLGFYYLYINNINMNSIILITDLLFSITYRIVMNI